MLLTRLPLDSFIVEICERCHDVSIFKNKNINGYNRQFCSEFQNQYGGQNGQQHNKLLICSSATIPRQLMANYMLYFRYYDINKVVGLSNYAANLRHLIQHGVKNCHRCKYEYTVWQFCDSWVLWYIKLFVFLGRK